MRYRDLQYLGAYAWQLKDNLSGTDRAAKIANLMFQIFRSTQCVDRINRTHVVSCWAPTPAHSQPLGSGLCCIKGCTKYDYDKVKYLKHH
jgi:hypothetical protein